jgi:acyl-CoA thioesterase-1
VSKEMIFVPLAMSVLLMFGLYPLATCDVVAQHKARAGRYAEIKNAPVAYLALGDSAGVGVGAEHGGYVARLFARVEQTHPQSRLFNRSASAARTNDVLQTQLADLSKIHPDLITLCVGANDLINGVKAEEFARNYGAIIARLKTETAARIVLMNIPDLSLAPAVPAYMRAHARRHIVAFNQLIAEIAARDGLSLVDLFACSGSFASHAEFFSRDGLHPSDAGYEFWAELLLPRVNSALDCRRKLKER